MCLRSACGTENKANNTSEQTVVGVIRVERTHGVARRAAITLQDCKKAGDINLFFVSHVNLEKYVLNALFHLGHHLKNQQTVRCPFLRCEFKTNNLKTFSSHRSQKHKNTKELV